MLLGRADEIAKMEGYLDDARGGVSAASIVHGDPGIGKSALLHEVVASASGFVIVRARPLQSESELPFAGLADLLRPLLPLLDRIPEPQAAVLSGALALGPPTPSDRFAAAAATVSLLAAGAETSPLLAVVDDAHWLDTPSREALLFAGRRLGNEGVVLLLATRDRPWLEGVQIERLELRGLAPEAASELVAGAGAGREIGPSVRERLITDTAGNPLAILEAMSMLADGQLAALAPISGPIAVGPTLERAFAQRLEPLPGDARRAVLLAAASDTGDAGEIARASADLGLAPNVLDAAERGGLLSVTDGTIEFRHPLLRSAAYHAAEPVDRREAHRTLARAIAADHPDRVAWHLAAAASGPDEEAASLLETTAQGAQARGGYVAAANALEASARLSPDDSDRVRRSVAAAEAFRLGGQGEASADILGSVLGLIADPEQRAEVQQLRGMALMNVRPMMDVVAMLIAEADDIESLDPGRSAMMLALASIGAVGSAEIPTAIDLAGRAVVLAEPTGGPAVIVGALASAYALTLAGRVAEARAHLDPLVPMLAMLDPLAEGGLMMVMAAHILSWMEDWEPARATLERMVDVARSASAITLLPHPLAILAELELRNGRVALSYAAAAESVQIAVETGLDIESTLGYATLARTEAVLGLEAECRSHVAATLGVVDRLGARAMEVYAAAALGVLELSMGHPELALTHLERCAHLERTQGVGLPTIVEWHADLIESYIRLGRDADATEALGLLDAQARETGSRWAAAVAARCTGLLAADDDFEPILREAMTLHGDHDPFELARTELCLGIRRRHARRRADARVVLHQALARFEGLGAERWAEQVRVELRATGEVPRPAPSASLTSLTPQELQVALVVAEGATNKEAAATLFISPKTVEFHLSHVYRKLGVRSRTELARKVAGSS